MSQWGQNPNYATIGSGQDWVGGSILVSRIGTVRDHLSSTFESKNWGIVFDIFLGLNSGTIDLLAPRCWAKNTEIRTHAGGTQEKGCVCFWLLKSK